MPDIANRITIDRLLRILATLAVLFAGGAALLSGGCDRQCGTSGDPDALIGGDFTAINHLGEAVTSDQFAGRYKLIFFGFTSCPDVCPTALATVSTALDLLGSDAHYFQPIFVSIDPDRDTPPVMADYLSNFHESFIGLTGTPTQVKDLAHVYRAYYARGQDSGNSGQYNMDHSSIIYLMDCEDRYISHFAHGTDVEEMAQALRDIL